jgi:hypothetical protein
LKSSATPDSAGPAAAVANPHRLKIRETRVGIHLAKFMQGILIFDASRVTDHPVDFTGFSAGH